MFGSKSPQPVDAGKVAQEVAARAGLTLDQLAEAVRAAQREEGLQPETIHNGAELVEWWYAATRDMAGWREQTGIGFNMFPVAWVYADSDPGLTISGGKPVGRGNIGHHFRRR